MNGRKARARAGQKREQYRAQLAIYRRAPLTFIRRDGLMEFWRRGPWLITVPVLQPAYPAALAEAVRIRRREAFDGECPRCGAATQVRGGALYVQHERACPAEDDNLERLASEAGLPTERVDT
jgi:hypothetical protein